MIATTDPTTLLAAALAEALADPGDPSSLAAVADLIEDGAGLVAGDFPELLAAAFAARLARRTPVVVHKRHGPGRVAASVTWRHSPRLFGVFEARPCRGLAFSWGGGGGRRLPVVDATSEATGMPRWYDAGHYDALRALRLDAGSLHRAGGRWDSRHVLPCLPGEVLAAGAELADAVAGGGKAPAPVDRSRWERRPGSLGGWSEVQSRSLLAVARAVDPDAEEVRIPHRPCGPAAAEVTRQGRFVSAVLEGGDTAALLGWRATTHAELLAAVGRYDSEVAADWGQRL